MWVYFKDVAGLTVSGFQWYFVPNLGPINFRDCWLTVVLKQFDINWLLLLVFIFNDFLVKKLLNAFGSWLFSCLNISSKFLKFNTVYNFLIGFKELTTSCLNPHSLVKTEAASLSLSSQAGLNGVKFFLLQVHSDWDK